MADVTPLPTHRVVPITAVTPAEGNPRRIPQSAVDATARSIENFGWKQPIVVDENMVIVAGHTRRLAALKLGLKEVPIIDATDLTPEQVKAYRIMDNRTGDYSTWDYDTLLPNLQDIELTSPDLLNIIGVDDWEGLYPPEPSQTERPDEFSAFSEDRNEDYRCPKCRFEWSGDPR